MNPPDPSREVALVREAGRSRDLGQPDDLGTTRFFQIAEQQLEACGCPTLVGFGGTEDAVQLVERDDTQLVRAAVADPRESRARGDDEYQCEDDDHAALHGRGG